MGWPGEVAFLLALFVLLGMLHGTRAQYEDYGLEDFDESDDDLFDYDDAYGGEEADLEEEFADGSRDTETDVDRDNWGSPPTAGAVEMNQEFTPDCNNENCWIRVDWESSNGWRCGNESGVHTRLQQRELLDQGGLGASSKGHLDVLSLGVQGWIQKTRRRLDLDERRGFLSGCLPLH